MTNEHFETVARFCATCICSSGWENCWPELRKGRWTALQIFGVGVSGVVAGDVIRRLVARTVAQ